MVKKMSDGRGEWLDSNSKKPNLIGGSSMEGGYDAKNEER